MSIYDPQSQRDPRWSGEQLGSSPGATIGQYGCFITVAAMMWSHFDGSLHTPHDVNQALKTAGRYVSGDLYPDSGLAFLDPAIQLEQRWSYIGIPADLSKLAMDDTEERLVIVDFDHNPNDGLQIHALRAFSWDGHTLIVDDPWYGTRDNFSLHYGTNPSQTIQAIVGYRAPNFVPPWKRPADPCAAISAQLTAVSTDRDQLKLSLASAKQLAAQIGALPQ